jgi:hypothetical protein
MNRCRAFKKIRKSVKRVNKWACRVIVGCQIFKFSHFGGMLKLLAEISKYEKYGMGDTFLARRRGSAQWVLVFTCFVTFVLNFLIHNHEDEGLDLYHRHHRRVVAPFYVGCRVAVRQCAHGSRLHLPRLLKSERHASELRK